MNRLKSAVRNLPTDFGSGLRAPVPSAFKFGTEEVPEVVKTLGDTPVETKLLTSSVARKLGRDRALAAQSGLNVFPVLPTAGPATRCPQITFGEEGAGAWQAR